MTHIDLHTHSLYSHDGEVLPAKLVEMALRLNIGHLAVADHNRVDGVKEALDAAADSSLTVIPCVELDCAYEDANLHVLGYFINYEDAVYEEVWNATKNREGRLNLGKIEGILKCGFHVDPEDLLTKTKDGILSDVTIAGEVLSDLRNKDNPALFPYREGGSRSKDPMILFSWDYLNKGGPAYVPSENPPLAKIVDVILSTGGVPVLAHPGANITGRERYLPGIIEAGVAGVEAYCNYHNPEQAAFWREAATANNVIYTCGSDYHGSVKPSIEMGEHGAEGLEAGILDSLLALRRRRV